MSRVAMFAALVLLAALVVARLGQRMSAWRRSRRARRRGARAVRGEHAAEQLLTEAGYAIVDRQAARDFTILVDGEALSIPLRADYLVDDDGRLLVAEVKTGDAAPLITLAATRRQLLEYRVAYDVDGVLLVDVEAGAIVEVEFFPAETTTGRLSEDGRPEVDEAAV